MEHALLRVMLLVWPSSHLCFGNGQGDEPPPLLTASPSWLTPGVSVNLSCQLRHPSAGWRFYWYRALPDLPHNSVRYELLPESTNGTPQDFYIIHGQKHTAGYKCRAARRNPEQYSRASNPKFVWSAESRPAASLAVSPNREQHFTSESVSLTCEGHSADWRVREFTQTGNQSNLSYCSFWRGVTGSLCTFESLRYHKAVYWCESASGDLSNAVNITIQDADVLLVSPVHPVTEGHAVSLSCRLRGQNTLSTVLFYHNDELVQNGSRGELSIAAVSQSDEGFYRCEHSGMVSQLSWMSVKAAASKPKSSSFPVQSVVGPVSGIILVVLVLMSCLKQCKGSVSEQTSDEHQQQVYSSLLHGEMYIYETIRGTDNSGNGHEDSEEMSEYDDMTPE